MLSATALLVAAHVSTFAQPALQNGSRAPSTWRKLGNHSVGMNLAGPAGGPIAAVWFAPLGDRLFIRTAAGQILETTDLSNWSPSRTPGNPPPEILAANIRATDPDAKVLSLGGRLWVLGKNLEVSDDGGRTFTNLTAYHGESIIGANQHALAISPLDPRVLVVGNDFGLWRSADGGLSWTGLNEELPNLPMRRLLPFESGLLRAEVEGIGPVELPPAAAASRANWVRSPRNSDTLRQAAVAGTRADITAVARSATTAFAGSADGRFWTSLDNGATWTPVGQRVSGRIEAIETGGETLLDLPNSALAIVTPAAPSTPAGPRLLRTINGGAIWDDIGGLLPEGALHGIAFDPNADVVYVAGDRGIFTAHVDMSSLAPVTQWQRLPGLPEAPVMDVRLDRVRRLLFVAVDGYGLYVSLAPHGAGITRILNAADQTAQVAAPGVLLRVEGNGLASVKSEGEELKVISSSRSSAQVQVPYEAGGPTLSLTVNSALGLSQFALPLKSVAPSILVDGDGLPIVVDAATGLTLDARNMAHPGSRIQVFAAGLGRVDPEWHTGVPAPENPPAVVANVEARIGGAPAEVLRATLAPGYVGLYLVEIQVPGLVNAGTADLALVVNGDPSNHVKLLLTVE